MRIARLECDACHTAIEGDFDRGRLGRLSREQLAFVEVFLQCRGKIKDVEQQLGLSYPTVVSRLEQVVQALGSSEAHDDARTKRDAHDDARTKRDAHDDARAKRTEADARSRQVDAVLEGLSRGELTPKDAAERLRTLRGPNSSSR